MKSQLYTVYFKSGVEIKKHAYNMTEAVIEAMGDMIKEQSDYAVDYVKGRDGVMYVITSTLQFEESKFQFN